MKKGATNGNEKKWWIRFLDEKVPTMETKEIVDSMLNERKNEKHHSGWMSSAALCTGPNFAAQCRGGRGIRNRTKSLRVSFRVSYLIPFGYPKDRVPGSDIYVRLSINKIPHFLNICDSWFSILFEKSRLTSQNNSGYVPVLR
jgi:hypothetical protein